MVKGITKQAVLVQAKPGADFEQAIFILKSEHTGVSERELLRQAEHSVKHGSRRRWLSSIALILSGVLIGGLIVGAFWLLSWIQVR